MTGRRGIVGLCLLCALVFSALAAQDVAAATNGTTGFTCKEKKEAGGTGFSDAHCKVAVGTGAKFEHLAIPENLATEGRVVNQTTEGKTEIASLKSTISGVEVELQAIETEGLATGQNSKDVSGEHFITGTGATTYSSVTVAKPAGKGCTVHETEKGTVGMITTKTLKGTSLGQGMGGKLEPLEGTEYVSFWIEGCSIEALNGKYTVTGSVTCPVEGATVRCHHAETTAQGTLKLRGQKAGAELVTTATARANSGEAYTAVAATTIETP